MHQLNAIQAKLSCHLRKLRICNLQGGCRGLLFALWLLAGLLIFFFFLVTQIQQVFPDSSPYPFLSFHFRAPVNMEPVQYSPLTSFQCDGASWWLLTGVVFTYDIATDTSLLGLNFFQAHNQPIVIVTGEYYLYRTQSLEGMAVKMLSVIRSAMQHLPLLMAKKPGWFPLRMTGLSCM